MIVWPGLRRSVSAIQRLFNSASVSLPLTHTAIPTRGSIVPTFTRATTETGQKWDEAGYLDFTALANEIVFKGARRVANLLRAAKTDDFSDASWTKSAAVTITPDDATFTVDGESFLADKIASNSGASVAHQCYNISNTFVAGLHVSYVYAKYAGCQWLALNTYDGANRLTYFDVLNGVVGTQAAGATGSVVDCGDGVYQLIVSRSSAATASGGVSLELCAADNTPSGIVASGNGVHVARPQVENVTGQTTQTASEYVSVGVESAPAYHGSMVDGVKCYDTDRSGNPISTSGSYPIVGYVPWEARTNLCLHSGNLAGASWVPTTATISANAAVGIDGAMSADLFYPTSTGTFRGLYQASVGSVASWSQFVIAKPAGFNWLGIVNFNGSGGSGAVWFDLVNGTIGSNTVSAPSTVVPYIKPCANGFYECGFTGTGAVGQFIQFFCADSNGSTTATASGTNGLYVYGCQVELGPFATPYIPTTTVAVARNANLLTYTGADVANIKTLACTFSRGVGVSTSGVVVALTDGTSSERHTLIMNTATSFVAVGSDGGVNQYVITASNAYAPGTSAKGAVTFATNDVKVDFNGTAQTPDTSATMPTVTQLNVGHEAGIVLLNGPVNHIYGWTRNLSQSELGAVDRA